jgi:BirA family transcriptional regulator, biotin operon repressor / biotin---[acetyl-CoA-carboxylase] ligase
MSSARATQSGIRANRAVPRVSAARLYRALGGGEFRSGSALAAELGLTRSGVWKAIRQLRGLGAEIHAVPNRGYRLRSGAPLDVARITAQLPARVRARARDIELAWSIPSTNATLLAQPEPAPGAARVLLAEYQTAGRGRRGRAWFAPLGGAVCLSVGWTFAQLPADLGAASLAVGVCALRALARHGYRGVQLKWPNDLVTEAGKLAGILIEVRGEAGGAAHLVIGLGLNVLLGKAVRAQIAASGTRAIDLGSLSSAGQRDGVLAPDRDALCASLIGEVVMGLEQFGEAGLKPFLEEWRRADALRGKVITVLTAAHTTRGVARGIDASGALLVETSRGLERQIAGEVSVRSDG